MLLNTRAFDYSYKQPESECYWRHKNIFLFYPCIEFLRQRIGLFNKAGMGGFVWDGGQGPYFFYRLL